jgi:hypothetical protein
VIVLTTAVDLEPDAGLEAVRRVVAVNPKLVDAVFGNFHQMCDAFVVYVLAAAARAAAVSSVRAGGTAAVAAALWTVLGAAAAFVAAAGIRVRAPLALAAARALLAVVGPRARGGTVVVLVDLLDDCAHVILLQGICFGINDFVVVVIVVT